jgi:hypothetical protein
VECVKTLLLDTVTWDLVVDANGNIALAEDPYSLAQDAASYIKTFQGEVYYDTTLGVPYWQQVLGRWPPLALMKSLFTEAALQVPEVQSSVCYVATWSGRAVTGQVQVSNAAGEFSAANFSTPIAGPTGLQPAPIPP